MIRAAVCLGALLVVACGSADATDAPRAIAAGAAGVGGSDPAGGRSGDAGSGGSSSNGSGGSGSGGSSGTAAAGSAGTGGAAPDAGEAGAAGSAGADPDAGIDARADSGGQDAAPDAAPCECSTGPCCDGCRFRTRDHVCGEAVYETRCRVTDGCRAFEEGYRASACNGDAPQCTRWGSFTFKWVSHGCGTC